MAIDFRPSELDIKCREETTFNMSIRYKKAGIVVAGSGDNKYVLECGLLDKLREKLKKVEEKDDG